MDELKNALHKVFFIVEVLTARPFNLQSGDKIYTPCVYTWIKFYVRDIGFGSRPGNGMLRFATDRKYV
jgi:hypothetical protein